MSSWIFHHLGGLGYDVDVMVAVVVLYYGCVVGSVFSILVLLYFVYDTLCFFLDLHHDIKSVDVPL